MYIGEHGQDRFKPGTTIWKDWKTHKEGGRTKDSAILINNRRKGELCTYHDRMKKQGIEDPKRQMTTFRANFTAQKM